MGAFKIGFIILFLQIAKLRHSFKNLPSTLNISLGELGFKAEVFDLNMCAVCWLSAPCDLFTVTHSLPCYASLWLECPFPPWKIALGHETFFGQWNMRCHVCAAALKTLVWFGSASHVLLFSATRKRETNRVVWNKPTHRIDPQSLGSPLVMWTRNECLYSKIQRFLGLLVTAAKAD